MQLLIEKLSIIGKVSPVQQSALMAAITRKEFAPKTILQKTDQVANKIYFVEKGIARTFYYKNGKDITYWIAPEGEFVGSMASFFMRTSSNKLVETIEHCTLWEFEYQKLESLFSSSQELEKVGRRFANYAIALMEERFDNLHFNTAKERYQLLMKNQSELINRIPLGMIASYLGITQETLSRIRSQV